MQYSASVKSLHFPFLIRECKSIDGVVNLDYTYIVQDPIVKRQCLRKILNKPKIQWSKGNQKAIWTNLDQ